jgi:hypothetical protein
MGAPEKRGRNLLSTLWWRKGLFAAMGGSDRAVARGMSLLCIPEGQWTRELRER